MVETEFLYIYEEQVGKDQPGKQAGFSLCRITPNIFKMIKFHFIMKDILVQNEKKSFRISGWWERLYILPTNFILRRSKTGYPWKGGNYISI